MMVGSFLTRFEDLKIDCNDQLHIYDGAHAIGNPKVKKVHISAQLYRLCVFSSTDLLKACNLGFYFEASGKITSESHRPEWIIICLSCV